MGGLTVLRALSEAMPSEDFVYLGDTARVPYGTRSKQTVTRYSIECMRFLEARGIKLLVVACNTASALGLKELRRKSSVPVIGVIEPGARAAAKASKSGAIGVIGTDATIKSKAYIKAIKAERPGAKIISKACPLFVPLVEEGIISGPIARLAAERYLGALRGKGIDALLLGCTHYPLLKETIGLVMGPGVKLIDSAGEAAAEAKTALGRKRLLKQGGRGRMEFFATDAPERVGRLGGEFLGRKMGKINIARLETEA